MIFVRHIFVETTSNARFVGVSFWGFDSFEQHSKPRHDIPLNPG